MPRAITTVRNAAYAHRVVRPLLYELHQPPTQPVINR
jgi:hypothetical protein